jgi:molecular chaperone DnaJ
MDPHTLLGLSPDASEREVKRAFRRLAMRWHPDRNSDPAALEHFKVLRAAYEALLARRAAANDKAAHGAPPDDAPERAEEPRTADGARDARARGADRREDLTLTIEEAYLGGARTIAVEDAETCPACDGCGEEVLRHTRLCTACHGSGRIRSKSGLVGCGRCAGRGYLSKQACTVCHGTGQQRAARHLSIRIPAGVLAGDELRIAGAGNAATSDSGPPGDLVLTVILAPHPLYQLNGRDLILTRPVSAFRMLLGGELPVPLPGGTRNVKLEPGGVAPCELRIRGAGFPARDGQAAGALIVRLAPVLPDAPDARLRTLFEKLEDELGADRMRYMPDLANWEARWLGSADRSR